MISASKGKDTEQSPDSTFAIIAKAHRRARRQHLTLDLCKAVQERTGKPLVPSTPAGLILLLDAMQPKISRHTSQPEAVEVRGKRVKELLRRYGEGGQVGAAVYMCFMLFVWIYIIPARTVRVVEYCIQLLKALGRILA